MKPFRITGLEAHQIGPFGELKMTFPEKPAGMEDKAEIHILTGENGVGKTTVLEMLIAGVTSPSNLRSYQREKELMCFNVAFSEGGNQAYEYDGTLSKGIRYNSFLTGDGKSEKSGFSFLAFAYSGYRTISHVEIESVKELEGSVHFGMLNLKRPLEPHNILQWIANNLAKKALAESQNDLPSAKRFSGAIKRLEKAVSKIIERQVEFRIEYDPFKVLIEIDGEILTFNQLPDGIKSIFSWLADLLMQMDRVKWVNDTPVFERNFILFLDEIEVHMHPKWQRKILPAVQGLFPNAQIFISTHSPFVVGSVDGAWVHRLVKPNGDSVPDGEPFLSEDGKSVLHVLEEVFGVTEQFGPDVERDLKQFYQLRDEVLKGANGKEAEALLQAGRSLAVQSAELQQIIEMEIRQVNRRKQMKLTL